MNIRIGDMSLVEDADGNIVITTPNILGGISVHTIKPTADFDIKRIANYLFARINGVRIGLVQNVFPTMSKEDREFLLTGITPEMWARIFPEGETE